MLRRPRTELESGVHGRGCQALPAVACDGDDEPSRARPPGPRRQEQGPAPSFARPCTVAGPIVELADVVCIHQLGLIGHMSEADEMPELVQDDRTLEGASVRPSVQGGEGCRIESDTAGDVVQSTVTGPLRQRAPNASDSPGKLRDLRLGRPRDEHGTVGREEREVARLPPWSCTGQSVVLELEAGPPRDITDRTGDQVHGIGRPTGDVDLVVNRFARVPCHRLRTDPRLFGCELVRPTGVDCGQMPESMGAETEKPSYASGREAWHSHQDHE